MADIKTLVVCAERAAYDGQKVKGRRNIEKNMERTDNTSKEEEDKWKEELTQIGCSKCASNQPASQRQQYIKQKLPVPRDHVYC